MTWLTFGGSGVGPAVIRYCLMKGLGVISQCSLAADLRRSEAERCPGVRRCEAVAPRWLVPPRDASRDGRSTVANRVADLSRGLRRSTGVGDTIAAMTLGRPRAERGRGA